MADMCSGREGDEGGVVVRTKQSRHGVSLQQVPISIEPQRGVLRDCFGALATFRPGHTERLSGVAACCQETVGTF